MVGGIHEGQDVRRPVLYVAGPYTRPDPVINTHGACRVGTIIAEQTNWIPLVPHITLLWHAVTPRPIDFWYDLDLNHMEICDAVVRLPGDSSGADAEMAHADEVGLTVIKFEQLPADARAAWTTRAG